MANSLVSGSGTITLLGVAACLLGLGGVVSASDIHHLDRRTFGDDPLCHDQLVGSLPISQLSSSDNRAGPGLYTGPERGRLNTAEVTASNGTTLEGAWSPVTDSSSCYLQATFNSMVSIHSILTQGRNQGNEYVTMYTVLYTVDGSIWKTYTNLLDVEEIFRGNHDGDSIQENMFESPILAKGIRIRPLDWNGHVALRFDVKGCYLYGTSIATTTHPVPTTTTTTTTSAITTTSTTAAATITTTASTTPTPSRSTPIQTYTTCNKLSTVLDLGNHKVSTNAHVATCPSGSAATPEAFVIDHCNVMSPPTWTQGSHVMKQCQNIPLYTPVATFFNQRYSSTGGLSGIFLGCLPSGFKLGVQQCDQNPAIVHLLNGGFLTMDPAFYYTVQ